MITTVTTSRMILIRLLFCLAGVAILYLGCSDDSGIPGCCAKPGEGEAGWVTISDGATPVKIGFTQDEVLAGQSDDRLLVVMVAERNDSMYSIYLAMPVPSIFPTQYVVDASPTQRTDRVEAAYTEIIGTPPVGWQSIYGDSIGTLTVLAYGDDSLKVEYTFTIEVENSSATDTAQRSLTEGTITVTIDTIVP